jgi:nucleotide-binding universal stress UspA family protein
VDRIVVGADGSAGSINALRWAGRLAAVHGAEVVVFSGYRTVEAELPPGRLDALIAEYRRRVEEWSEAAKVGDVPVRTVVTEGDARPGLLEVADDVGASLIVVGRVGSSTGPGPLHLGSVAEWLSHHTERPLAVVGGRVHPTVRSVLVGVDGSGGSRAAVAWVVELCRRADIRVVAASVEEPFLEWSPSSSPKNWRRRAEEQIRSDFAAELTSAGVEFTELALSGLAPADALLEAAAEERTDAIVVGMRGLGGFTGLRIGGVALKLLHRADRPVILIPTT